MVISSSSIDPTRVPAARVDIVADRRDTVRTCAQIAGDRDLGHRILNGAVFHPEAGGAARVVAGHGIDPLPHQFGQQQPAAESRQHCRESARGIRRHDEIVRTAGIAGGFKPELARRVARQNVAGQYAVGDQFAIACRNALFVERRTPHRLRDVRSLADGEAGRKHLLPDRVQQEGGLPVLTAAADRADEMPDQAARHFGREQAPARAAC